MERESGGALPQRAGALLAPLGLPEFRRLWLADLISLLGDWAGRLALTVVVLDRTGSPAWAAGVTAVSLAGFVGIGQVLATLADRFGRVSVMLVADIARAALFAAMLLHLPVGALLLLAFLAGLATPPFEAARSAALPDLVPEHRYGDALALAGITVQSSIMLGSALGGVLLVLVGAQGALAINAASFLVSGALILSLRNSAAASPANDEGSIRGSLRGGAQNLFRDRMVRRAMAIVAVAGALGTVAEALVVPYARHVGLSSGYLGLLAAAVPVGALVGTGLISRTSDHHRLLRAAGACTFATAVLAAPLFWLEVGGASAFLAFAVAGGMFAVSVPTNVVIGTRLRRETRASAMGIAVGILMGSQALGATAGGLLASTVGPPHAIAGALVVAAVFGGWSTVTTPIGAKHMAGQRQLIGAGAPSTSVSAVPQVVVDLVALEAEAAKSEGESDTEVQALSVG